MNPKPLLAAFALVASVSSAFAQLIIPSDGSDGAFNPAANVEIDLSQAVTGTWSNPSTSPGNGIYDAEKWAIVFKYSSINIPAGVTVTFKNHPTYAPVVWLVQGSVNIAGTVNLNGTMGVFGSSGLSPAEPGPGGFRGGAFGPAGNGTGFGPGGGPPSNNVGNYNSAYGNPQLLPLIGGSGGGGGNNGYSGGAGGGAILIAAPGTMQIGGILTSIGGPSGSGGTGSGGALRLVANSITGNGTLTAATTGRVRIEANSLSATITSTPPTIAIAPGTTPTIFQSATSPVVKIISVDGLPAPADPTAPLASSADIAIQKNTPVTIVLKTYNFATAGAVVALRVNNKYASYSIFNATLQGGGTSAESTWIVSTTLAPGFVTLQARATAP